MEFCELKEVEYQQFQLQHPYCNFLNGIETITLEKKEGFSCEYVGIKENGQVIAATSLVKMPVMRRFFYYYAPRGILVDYKDEKLVTYFASQLKSYAKKKGIIYIVCDPYVLYKERDIDGQVVENGFHNEYVVENLKKAGWQHKGFSVGYGHNMQWIRWMYSMSLKGKDKDILWKELHSQTRWSINKTIKYKMQVRELSYEELSIFDEIMAETSERKEFDSRDISFYRHQVEAYHEHSKVLLAYLDVSLYKKSVEEELKKEEEAKKVVEEELKKVPNSKKFTKKLNVVEEAIAIAHKRIEEANTLEEKYGNIIPMAASMFMLYGDEVTYLTSGAYGEFRTFCAPYAIQWHIINEAIEKGYKKYNFYGISGDFDEKSKEYGVYQFKRGFPGQVEELVGDFVLPVRNTIYKLYRCLKK